MKKIMIALMITALMTCALVSCVDSNNDITVAESSNAQDFESSVAATDNSVTDESSAADESNTETSEPIGESEASEESAKEEIKVKISVEFATEELLANEDAYVLYDDPDSDYSFVAFTTDTRVTNVRYFSIVSTDTWSDDGAPKIDEVLYTLEEFTPEMAFVAETVFGDVYALRGISFEDANGNTQYYSLWDSAVDDSIGLSRADIAE